MQHQVLTSDTTGLDFGDLGMLIRRAREQRRFSIRELGRQSGVSAGQISRIEAGSTASPSRETLQGLARALGRHPMPLMVVAGHLHGPEAIAQIGELADEMEEGSTSARDAAQEAFESIRSDESELRHAAGVLFDASVADPFGAGFDRSGLDREALEELREIARAWPALSSQRRRLVRALVADQEVLSGLERLPSSTARYRLDVRLEATSGSDDE